MKQSNLQIADPYNMTPQEAQSVIGQLVDEKEETRWKFYTGDHWQESQGWVGPMIPSGTEPYSDFITNLEKSFIFYNSCGEVTDRNRDAVLSKPPQWGAALERVLDEGEDRTENENDQILLVDELLTTWFDSKAGVFLAGEGAIQTCNIKELLGKTAARVVATGRAYLRMFIPSKYLEEGTLERVPLTEALARIRVELCDVKSGYLYIDSNSMDSIGVYVYKDKDENDRVELTFIDANGMTALKTSDGETVFDLGGELLHHQINIEPLLKDSVLSLQKDLNRTLTMAGHNMNLGGFPERVLLDGMVPGDYEKDPKTGKKRFIPDEFRVGAGAMNVFNGITYTDDDGKTRHVSPSYQRLDPVSGEVFSVSAEQRKQDIRDEADQSHVAMSSDATASGRSREQARHEFIQSLMPTAEAVESALKWILTTAMRLAIATSNESPALMEGLKINVETQVDSGPVSAEDRAEDRKAVDDGLMSKETAMNRIGGIDDTDVERGRIESESETNLAIIAERITAASALIASGTNPKEAYLTVGFSEEVATKLSASGFITGGDDDANAE